MDRNQATGLFLISALLLVYLFFFRPKKDDKPAAGKTPTATTAATTAPAAPHPLPSWLAHEAALDTTAGVAQDVTLAQRQPHRNLLDPGRPRDGRAPEQVQDLLRPAAGFVRCEKCPHGHQFRTVRWQNHQVFGPGVSVRAVAGGDGASVLTFTAPVAGGSIVQTYSLARQQLRAEVRPAPERLGAALWPRSR